MAHVVSPVVGVYDFIILDHCLALSSGDYCGFCGGFVVGFIDGYCLGAACFCINDDRLFFCSVSATNSQFALVATTNRDVDCYSGVLDSAILDHGCFRSLAVDRKILVTDDHHPVVLAMAAVVVERLSTPI